MSSFVQSENPKVYKSCKFVNVVEFWLNFDRTGLNKSTLSIFYTVNALYRECCKTFEWPNKKTVRRIILVNIIN